MPQGFDIAVVGGGMVGSAIAYGLARQGVKTAMLDEGDIAFRAARGNFGLVWVQRKGADAPDYAAWTRQSADSWPEFSEQLREETGVNTGYERPGGLEICVDESELSTLAGVLQRIEAGSDGAFRYEMLDRQALRSYLPRLGDQVVGGSYCPLDGHANPLYLLRALHAGFLKHKGQYLSQRKVLSIKSSSAGFTLHCDSGDTVTADRIILAAGIAGPTLAPQVGLNANVRPIRGQILITEKVQPFLNYPTLAVRQTQEGGCMLGYSDEEVGKDEGTSASVMGSIAKRAVTLFPFLHNVQVVRAWGALRTMTGDGHPIYDESVTHPGAFLAATHSGVTLAAAHAQTFSGWIADGRLPDSAAYFRAGRFDV